MLENIFVNTYSNKNVFILLNKEQLDFLYELLSNESLCGENQKYFIVDKKMIKLMQSDEKYHFVLQCINPMVSSPYCKMIELE